MDGIANRRFSDAGTALYQVLELEKGATADDIKRAYRRLALRFHPDKNPNDVTAADKFKDINKAHKILSDPDKKRIYDEHGSLGLHIIERFGEENAKYYFMMTSWWAKALFGICCILTGCCCGCYFCCCCCLCCCKCCCGKCSPKIDEEDIPNAEDLAAEEEAEAGNKDGGETPITTQPGSTPSPKKTESPNGNSNSTPIALGPPVASSALIVLGPPPSNVNERSELTTTVYNMDSIFFAMKICHLFKMKYC